MEDLLEFLPRLLTELGSSEPLREAAVFGAWNRVVGRVTSDHCVPFRLFKQRLIILTSDRIWKTQMERISGEIRYRLNRTVGDGTVTFIEYRVDPAAIAKLRAGQPDRPDPRLSTRIRTELSSAAAQIQNADLQDLFLRAAMKYLSRQELPVHSSRQPSRSIRKAKALFPHGRRKPGRAGA